MASNRGIHGSWIILSLMLAGMAMLFLASGAALIYAKIQYQSRLTSFPWLFYVNTAILIYISIRFKSLVLGIEVNHIPPKSAEFDQQKVRVIPVLYHIFYLSIVFLILQCIAWYHLLQANGLPSTEMTLGYLYFFSILHFFHVLGGIPYLWNCIQKIKLESLHQNDALVRKIKLLETYWRFLDYVWIYIMLILLISKFF